MLSFEPLDVLDLGLDRTGIRTTPDNVTCERTVDITDFKLRFADCGELLVAGLFEALARLGRQHPVQLRRLSGRGDVRSLWWASPGESFRDVPSKDVAALLETKGETAPLSRAVTISLGSLPDPAITVVEDLEVGCILQGSRLTVVIRVALSWCQTGDPHSEVDALAELISSVFRAVLACPEAPTRTAEGMSPEHRKFVLGPLAGRERNSHTFKPLPELLRESTARYGERIAYRQQQRTLSFTAFEHLANGLAKTLASRGVQHGDLVPVMFRSSLEMPVGYYALMKCGAGLVPVDFYWPEERLRHALDRFGSSIILCSEGIVLPAEHETKRIVVRIDEITPSAVPAAAKIEPDDVIYGFFTSGTTGSPKCALNTHRALSNRFAAMNRYLGDIGGPVLQNTRYMYDSSIGHMFLALTQGHEVVLPHEQATLDLEDTIATIHENSVAMTDFVPSVLNQLISLLERSEPAQKRMMSLCELIVGGEQITPKMIQKMRALLSPELRVSNCYGITETAIGLTYHPVRDEDGLNIPLGRPLDNCYLIITDKDLRPLPRGSTGQIIVGGACVGRGYMDDPDRTAAVFLPNPFAEIPGPTIYQTGDLGYFDSHGNLQFQGRSDHQAKIGGIIFEPAEVESAAFAMPAVSEAKAMIVEKDGHKSIALAVTTAGELDKGTLGRLLKTRLPRSLVPKHILMLEKMPVADSGKLDLEKLRNMLNAALEAKPTISDADLIPASTDINANVLSIFRAILSNHSLSIQDDFFDAGGDSLQAVMASMRVEEIFQLPFGTSDLIECRTAAAVAERVASLQATGSDRVHPHTLVEQDFAKLSRNVPKSYPVPRALRPRSVLLTGASGFVGSHLATRLLSEPDLRVTALCRSAGKDDMLRILARQKAWVGGFEQRLEVVHGDLAQDGLGMDEQTRARLASSCDTVLHCGAMVNFAYDYRVHRDVNVLGTLALLAFARNGPPKAFHYISTMGVLHGHEGIYTAGEEEEPNPDKLALPKGGYSQSKLVAERLVQKARMNGLDARIYRLGEIMPSSDGGEPNKLALTHLLLSAFALTGAVPAHDLSCDWTPVDTVAEWIIDVMLNASQHKAIYHCFNGEPVLLNAALAKSGMHLDTVCLTDWLRRVDDRIAREPVRELMLLRSMLPKSLKEEQLHARFCDLITDNTAIASPSRLFAVEEWRLQQGRSVEAYASLLADGVRACLA